VEVSTLILPGYCGCEDEEELVAAIRPKSYLRRMAALSKNW